MDVSAIVVNWNSGVALGACLASLFDGEPWGGTLEVFLVDNGSTDGSQVAATRAHPTVTLIQSAENQGFARAVNQGLRLARGELALLVNPDVVLSRTTVPLLTRFMARYPDAAAVGPRLLNPDGSVQGSARRAPSAWTGLFGRSAPLTRLFPDNPFSRRELPGLFCEGESSLEVDWVAGACVMVRRAAYEAVGLMDERFFLFWEDADWCLRFRQAGWKVYYLPGAAAMHHVGVSRAGRRARSAIDFHRSAYRFYRKHHLRSPLHPMMGLLLGGLLCSLILRLAEAVVARNR